MNKKNIFRSLSILTIIVCLLSIGSAADAQEGGPSGPDAPQALVGTAFTYQGQLMQGGSPVNGNCDMLFSLYDRDSGGNLVGGPIGITQAVAYGLFTARLDFGEGVFNGEERWLWISVRCPAGVGEYTSLSRQRLTPAPYALALPGLYTRQHSTSPNLIGGYAGNSITDGVYGAIIGGGGSSGGPNRVTDRYGVVGGGWGNRAGDDAGTTYDAYYAVVGGGSSNFASGAFSTIGGGRGNLIGAAYATIAGGGRTDPNDISTGNRVTDDYGTVCGGGNNQAGDWDQYSTTSRFATVSGGFSNTAREESATVSGGRYNSAIGWSATVSGGSANEASGEAATIPGGYFNFASGDYSFAAGNHAKALHDGAFVWADNHTQDFNSVFANSFSVRSTGGVALVLGIFGDGSASWSCLVSNGNSWACSSDRNMKENLMPVDGGSVLDKLSALPVFYWNGKGQDPNVRHLGPTAQDFYAAFDLGDDDKLISTIDLDGVALSAIQGLHALVKEQDAQIARQQEQIDALEARLSALERASGAAYQPIQPAVSSASPWLMLGGMLLLSVVVLKRGKGNSATPERS